MSPTPPPGPASGPSPALTLALQGLQAAAQSAPGPTSASGWRWTLRQRVTAVRDVLVEEQGPAADGWLAARGGPAFEERNDLLARLATLAREALEGPDVAVVRADVARLAAYIGRHVSGA